MPPRPLQPSPRTAPDWTALLIERARKSGAHAAPPAHRRNGPATLAEAIHRFVDRNWD